MTRPGAEPLDEHFTATVSALAAPAAAHWPDDAALTAEQCLALFDAQLGSRHLDFAARVLRARGRGYYTIGSSGHEGNAAVAAALRPTDPALLHYRSGGFFLARAAQVGGSDPIRDVLLGMAAAAEEPIAGGRHKVFGRVDLNIIPQTSTIASHLPRALGVAFSIARAKKLGVACRWPDDAVVVCSFGDASVNHSTAVGAINTALHAAYQGVPIPLLLVCEDNEWGISVRTPPGWIEHTYAHREGLAYFSADGSDLPATYQTAVAAADYVRTRRRPAFLHLRMVRLMGHAGTDYEPGYRNPDEIRADYARDPLLRTARMLVEHGVLTPQQILDRYEAKRANVIRLADDVGERPRLASADEVMRPLREMIDRARAVTPGSLAASVRPRHAETHLTVAAAINRSLHDLLDRYPEAVVFGEDVARKGGVYGVTRGLLSATGAARVFDTLLDEQSVLGLALGAGLSGLLPIAEIQYLAYLHNAADQLRGEAATLQFFTNRQYRNPMVVRIAGFGYQRGFGGHFHNDNSIAALRDIPGVVIASPARPDDAAAMLHTCAAAAREAGAVCLFLEPIALYHTRDLHHDGDGGWLAPYPDTAVPIGAARVYGDGTDLTMLTFGNGVRMSLRVARRLAERGIGARIVDLRWLAPLPESDMLREADATGRVLVVDETRHSGGVGEGLLAALVEHGYRGRMARVAGRDSFIPLGDAAQQVLLGEDTIEAAAVNLMTDPA
ncbi:transketolase, pyrimidine binding domain protein [Mycolicibacterium hassiacum DSM 44199]|jgi:2-oxoisovalerate dehydrogenase E1 component|uniref:Transketolase, pyrimidine binding domain protein n=1 Tax=Mycolicibacterium hassiacum (strain DSM 44199 / CIP 105218 / JCM 12690 / 3849) TaxID=1122247 RepID=K5B780_MYCHD|nr:thiamine pyrophosphate-dependent enzyme [Mycolicibacterium hassiacum]EKF21483.1 transketolase, pyrimidine binding domain protein [Mycolicibacterium hassiacum DSM 44199]MBX5488709.1 MFS transporter [Mycolicibacterium hassiacum]MDA4087104.1 MFS transporter [Mycolicibacterium hassiacum DSM 44199]VCT89335.1 2-oxoisovalerate dehydrogenase subunit beta [Mycolicibacterium hassiacum DSM 44199]